MSIYPMKILVATDGSERAHYTLEMAAELARKTASELHVVHVGLLSPWVHPDTLSEAQYTTLKEEAQARLDQGVAQLTELGGGVAAAHLRMGRVDAEVIELSEELGVGMIIVGNRGQGTVQRILLGNDAESIVRHAPCPVMVVRSEG